MSQTTADSDLNLSLKQHWTPFYFKLVHIIFSSTYRLSFVVCAMETKLASNQMVVRSKCRILLEIVFCEEGALLIKDIHDYIL
jgi:hypothetical protein